MDLGTGVFVAVKGLDTLRRDLRRANVFQTQPPTTIPNQLNDSKSKTKKSESTRIPRFLPLLVIGLARAAFVQFSGYYQDPLEYGTHWNFFITLAIIEVMIKLLFILKYHFRYLFS